MRASLLLARKDLLVMFRSPLAYVVLASFLLVYGVMFAISTGRFIELSFFIMRSRQAMSMTAHEALIAPLLGSAGVLLLFFLPLMTMRGFSEEKRAGTFELLMSYPLTEAQIVGGKLISLAVFLLVELVFALISPALLFLYTAPELGALLVGFAGLYLMSLSFASLGLFLSSLTENQIISAVLSFAALLVLWLLSWVRDMAGPGLQKVVDALALLGHFSPFSKGVLDFADVVYYLAFTTLFFFLSVLSLENQRWRG